MNRGNIQNYNNFCTIICHPHWSYLVCKAWFSILVCAAGFALSGMDNVPFRELLLAASIALGMFLLYEAAYLCCMSFEVTEEQILVSTGVFCRSRHRIELYRVYDYTSTQPVLMRLLGYENLVINSGDRNTPELLMPGMPVSFDLANRIRKRVEYIKRQKRIYELTNV